MVTAHPGGLPELFLDRSLGRRQVPALLRNAGLQLHTLAEVYGIPEDETITDTEWLARAGQQGWVVLMKDGITAVRIQKAVAGPETGQWRGGRGAHRSHR